MLRSTEPAYRILGPLQIGGALAPRSQQARVLGLLLLERGAVVSTAELSRWALGSGRSTDSAQIHVLVARLRRLVRDRSLPGGVSTAPGGYRFHWDEDGQVVDSNRFDALVEAAHRQRERDPATARRLVEEALGLWRGDVLAGLGIEEHPAAVRLSDTRLDAYELLFTVELATGRLERLPEMLEQHRRAPDRERLTLIAMSALFLAGRQTEALALYQRARQHVAATTGLEPGEDLRRAEAAVLRHDIAPILRECLAIEAAPFAIGRSPPWTDHRVATPMGRTAELPRFATSFVGRDDLLAHVLRSVVAPGMLSLVGPGGVGKTRLICEALGGATGVAPDAVWFCELSALGDAPASEPGRAPGDDVEGLAQLVADAVSARLESGRDPIDSIADQLCGRSGVLVLDSCETQVGACASLCRRLLESGRSLTIVATSRVRLGLAGERICRVPPLATDDDAIELYCHRAIDADPNFTLGVDDLDAIAEVCHRLDGLPLAIELAAARSRTAGPRELLGHLDGAPLDVLRAQIPVVPERHRSLSRTIEWSYRLLEPGQQDLLRRMSAFSGAADIDDVAAVCAHDQDHPTLLDRLGALVDRSTVTAVRRGGVTRYRLLDTIRAFGLDRADAAGELDDIRLHHAEHYARRLAAVKPLLRGPAEAVGVAQLDQIWPELRTAVLWSVRRGHAGLAVRLTAGLGFEAVFRERREVVRWADEVLTLTGALDQPGADELLGTAGLADWGYGMFDRGIERARHAVELHQRNGTRLTPDVAAALPLHQSLRGIAGVAELLHAHSLEAAGDGERYAEVHTAICEAMVLGFGGAPAAEDVLVEAERLAQNLGCPLLLAIAAFTRAIVVLDVRAEEAVAHARRCLALAESVGATWFLSAGTNYLVAALARSPSPHEAHAPLRAGLERQLRGATVQSVANTVRNTVMVLDRVGCAERVIPLIGWLEVNRPSIPGTPGMRGHPTALAERLRAQLGDTAYLTARAEGIDLTVEGVIRAALRELDEAVPPPATDVGAAMPAMR
jgi:predicted ATPase/DNA-binding SARP family transcriptional activator